MIELWSGRRRAGAVRETWLDAMWQPGTGGAVHTNAITAGTAEKLVDGLASYLASEIPQGHVHATDRAHGHRAAFVAQAGVVHRGPERLNTSGILPNQHWFEPPHFGNH